MNTQVSPMLEFLKVGFPDDIRHPLLAESKDWETILPVIEEGFNRLVSFAIGCPENIHLVTNPLLVVIEDIYVMGYMRGKREAQEQITFLVGEEEK